MRKHSLYMLFSFLVLTCSYAQVNCTDWNGYVQSRNTGGTGYYNLTSGLEERASQTYHLGSSGKITQLRVYGNYPFSGGVPLRLSIYAVDVNGRPTNLLASADAVFWSSDNANGYITVTLPSGGVSVNTHFAVGVQIRNAYPYGTQFQLKYTGDGEGLGDDLASLSGTSTGNNWVSAKNTFNKDGDFYLLPKMNFVVDAAYSLGTKCLSTGGTATVNNNAQLCTDSMFNRIFLSSYMGTEEAFTWNFGDGSSVSHVNAPSHSYVNAGSYTHTLQTTFVGWQNTCTQSKTTAVSVGLTPQVISTIDATCAGSANGSATVSASGGLAPYSYAIHNPSYQSSTVFSSLPAGNYTLTVRDNNACSNTSSFSIDENNDIQMNLVQSTQAACGSANGSLHMNASGGTGSFQFKLNNGSYQSSGIFNGLAAGTYVVTAKDAEECTKTMTALVQSTNAPTLSILSQTDVSCHDGSNGTLSMIGTGGVGQLVYSINGGQNFSTTATYTNLQAGEYTIVVKDGANCRYGQLIQVEEPDVIAFSSQLTSPLCNSGNNGTINITNSTGGVGALSYSLNNVSYQSNPIFANLVSGNYTIYVKDIAGCVSQQTVNLTQPLPLNLTTNVTSNSCFGAGNGALNLIASGGNAPYTFSINGGQSYQSTSGFTDLTAGNYSLRVMDANGCLGISATSIAQPAQVNGTATTTNSTCGNNNGGMLVTGSGGTGSGYQYSLDGINFNTTGLFNNLMAGNYYVTIKDGLGCSNVIFKTIQDANGPLIGTINNTDVSCNGGQDGTITVNGVTGGTGMLQYSANGIVWNFSPVIVGLSAGTYNVYVRDANGCIGSSSVTINQPNAFNISLNTTPISCHNGNNGTATILAAGGSGSLAYSINGGQTFQSSNVFSNLDAGNYTVLVRDFASCTSDVSFTLFDPTPIVVAAGALNVSCYGANDGSLSVSAYGGTGALTYSIDGTNYQISNVFNNLDGGFYTVHAKDVNGCIKHHIEYVYEPQVLALNAALNNINCAGGNDGMINLSATGGNGNYQFEWSNNETSEDLTGLEAGTYTVQVEDNKGCMSSATYQLTEPSQPIVVNATIIPTTSNNGSIDATVTGGTSPYTFLWSNGSVQEDVDSLIPGTYTLTVTDDNGCVSSDVFIVENSSGLEETGTENNLVMLFPNPVNEYLQITSTLSDWIGIEVVDLYGRVIYTSKETGNTYQLDVKNWSTGVYQLVIYMANQTITKRFVVE